MWIVLITITMPSDPWCFTRTAPVYSEGLLNCSKYMAGNHRDVLTLSVWDGVKWLIWPWPKHNW